MFYGTFSANPLRREDSQINRIQKIMSWEGHIHHQITYGNFSGGFFLNPRLPYVVGDCMFLDISRDLLVLMSGRIYNRRDICQEIGLNPETVTDPSLVSLLYNQLGPEFVIRLNGDFAIAIYQSNKNTLFLFRDHLGIRPLTYTLEGTSFYFSSDMLGLCRTFQASGTNSLNIEYLLSAFKLTDSKQTPNKRVLKVLPGYYLISDSRNVKTKKYWKPEDVKTDYTLAQEQVFAELKSLLTDAVRIRSDSRFRAGAHVSGGLDSGVVAALARREYQNQEIFYGYSWSSPEFSSDDLEYDEREHVQKTCDMVGIKPVYVHLTLNDFIELSADYINNQGYLQEEKILDFAERNHVNLLFSGWGGDEFISKGNSGVDSDFFFHLKWADFLKRNPWSQPRKLLATLANQVFFPALGIVKPSIKKENLKYIRYLKRDYQKEDKHSLKNFFSYTSRRALHVGMLYNYHLSKRTETWYINGFKHGIEYRFPLLDKRIIEYMLKVPSQYIVDGQYARMILRKITEGLLPEEVRWKKSKYDPVFFALMKKNNAEAGRLFKNEMSIIKTNPHLSCFDFDLLENDLQLYEDKQDLEALKFIYTDIFSIKLIHEFIKRYTEEYAG